MNETRNKYCNNTATAEQAPYNIEVCQYYTWEVIFLTSFFILPTPIINTN